MEPIKIYLIIALMIILVLISVGASLVLKYSKLTSNAAYFNSIGIGMAFKLLGNMLLLCFIVTVVEISGFLVFYFFFLQK